MDVPSLVRLRSLASFEQPDSADWEEGGDCPPPPASLTRERSSGCSGHSHQVSVEEVEASTVRIQRAVRNLGLTSPKNSPKNSDGLQFAKGRPAPKPKSKAAAVPLASVAKVPGPSKSLLTRGGLDYVCWLGGP